MLYLDQIFSYFVLTYSVLYKYVFLCCRTPARGVCPNYEVVEFQPRTGNPLDPRIC